MTNPAPKRKDGRGINGWNTPKPTLSDAELSDVIYEDIQKGGSSFSNLYYRLRGLGYSISEKRVRRVWVEECDGPMNPYYPFR